VEQKKELDRIFFRKIPLRTIGAEIFDRSLSLEEYEKLRDTYSEFYESISERKAKEIKRLLYLH